MIDVSVKQMWESGLTDEFYEFTEAEQLQLKICFYSGVHSMLHVNSMLHGKATSKDDYVAHLKILHDECVDFDEDIVDINNRSRPEKPKLKLVEKKPCNAPEDGIS